MDLSSLRPDDASTSYISPKSIAKASILSVINSPNEIVKEKLSECFVYKFTRNNPCPCINKQDEILNNSIMRTINLDSFETAKLVLSQINNNDIGKPLVLNMANEYNCGGGFNRAWGSQEECLFRRSTLGYNLWPYRRKDDNRLLELDNILPRKDIFYPLTECGGLYSPNIAVIRNIHALPFRSSQYKPDERYLVSVVSIAAQDLRYWMSHVIEKDFNEELTKQKLRTLLYIAVKHNHKCIILGALGCGAFQNKPEHISNIFYDLLNNEFKGVFKLVLFAIINSEYNLTSFSQRFPIISQENINNELCK